MSFTKPKIYNLALSALLLAREVTDVDTDQSNEVRVLNTHYDIALRSTIQDLDLDSTSTLITLELYESLSNEKWLYAYKYPTNCSFLRRLDSVAKVDRRSTHISKRVALRDDLKVIYTDEQDAVAECIPNDVPLGTLSSMAGMAVAYKLAYLSAPLIVGKGAKTLRESILMAYNTAKMEAQETDARENFNYEEDYERSEFVEARLS